MNSNEIVLTLISILGTISSILFAYLAFKKSNKQEHKDEGKNEGVVLSELSNKLVKVEESTKNAHKRITELYSEIKGG